ncbi:TonB-dependent receptor [Zunongwangia sp. SCSIO 43204]|uniref:SusC/RagA family TonB-linked outer membrane protein n=1 Tax=Zunongwangia sp. SCSIO 43204 TaxID=2779359 RepID=UPI001CA82BDE|nr:TonB-dependent receptor [Zunongwangia sp. SCSIO 43204]UAB84709.1 TonB-dependent receptor [Zunongwangia sp. SCSIO 43204]
MKKTLHGLLTLFMVLVVQLVFAQEKTVTGTVVDEEGLPLPGVNVIQKGSNNGVQTNFDGEYSINVPSGSILVFSYVGFAPQERSIGSSDTINVTLAVDAAALDEVVVMGYVAKRREDMTGSTVQIDSDQINQIPQATVDQALQGRVAGLQISSSSGTPGSTQDIRIRGISSLTAGNEPLYVIDGVPVINSNVGGNSSSSSLSALASLSNNDIESISVLKDASATAVYGARGANGVIVITTKSGKAGKTRISLNSYYGFSNNAIDGPQPLSGAQREMLLYESVLNTYGENYNLSTPEEAADFYFDQLGDGYGYQDWIDAGRPEANWGELVTNDDAPIQEHVVSATGGTDDYNFYTSFGYFEQEATVIGSTFDRVSGSLNFSKDLSESLEFSTSNTASHTFQDGILEGSAYFSSPHSAKYFTPPLNQPYNDDGTFNLGTALPNPLYISENDIDESKFTRILSNNSLTWHTPIQNLSLKSRASIDYQVYDYKRYRNRVTGDGSSTDGYGERTSRKTATYVFQNSLNYFNAFGNHNVDITVLQEYQEYRNNYLFAAGDSFVTDGLTNLASSGNPTSASASFSDWYIASYLATGSYNFDSKYVLNATYRREGNSRFSDDNRWGNFWAFGAAWNLHRESFLSDSEFVNNLKIRGSYGKTGNANIGINNYQVLFNYNADYAGTGASYPAGYGNPDLTWETSYTLDVGLDFGLLQNRLTGTLGYYDRRSEDLLFDVPLSFTTGFSSQYRNVGSMKNTGFEAELNIDAVRSNDFNFSFGGNVATVDNEVLEVAQDANGVDIPVTNNVAAGQRSTTGTMAYEWFMPTWAGVDPETGVDTYYTDETRSETTTDFGQADRVFQGASALPTLTAGVNIHVDFKGFFLDAQGYYAGGHKIYEAWHRYLNQPNLYVTGVYNGYTSLLDRWQQPGDQTRVARAVYGGQPWTYNSKFLFDGDYFRLRNVTFGYDLEPEILENIGMSGARIFLRGTNLYTWVKDDNLVYDPEVDASGMTSIVTPPVQSFILGVNLNF